MRFKGKLKGVSEEEDGIHIVADEDELIYGIEFKEMDGYNNG